MLGMHGTVFANYAVNDADLLLAMGVRFDDRVTGAACSSASLPTLDPAMVMLTDSRLNIQCAVRQWHACAVGVHASACGVCQWLRTMRHPVKYFLSRVAGKLETFAERARIVHVDVDPAEINKNKEAHIPMCTTTKAALAALVAALDARPLVDGQYGAWVATLAAQREEFPMVFPARDDVIIPQRAIQACCQHRRCCHQLCRLTMLRCAALP